MHQLRLLTAAAALLVPAAVITGCHSPYIQATVHNRSGQTISVVEVDYPSASFGIQNLASGADFHYRFKILGQGPTKITYSDAAHREHTSNGPSLNEGTEGLLDIFIDPADVRWQTTFKAGH